MTDQKFNDIYSEDLAKGAILNELMFGFKEDYLVLHCLLRKYAPKTVFEIGTHIGTGTEIICNAVPRATVYSLDLPVSMAEVSKQHPSEKGEKVGHTCKLKYNQLYGNSMDFNYAQHPCEAYFIDGEHTEKNVFHETSEILKLKPKMIIYHDADMLEVYKGIVEAFIMNDRICDTRYELYRVTDTRILYALKK